MTARVKLPAKYWSSSTPTFSLITTRSRASGELSTSIQSSSRCSGRTTTHPRLRALSPRFAISSTTSFTRREPDRCRRIWAGLGAIRRDPFLDAGGFDAERYSVPSIEDIELGARLAANRALIVLDPHLQGTHLKHWSLMGDGAD